jgi:hypothetical protein
MFSLSKNLCELNNSKSELNQLDEDFKLSLHEKCGNKTLELLEINARNETNRNLLKKSLNNYCNYVRNHISELTGDEDDASNRILDISQSDESELTIVEKWKRWLYQIVIAIVRILRVEFDSENYQIEIELIIYFYELLLVYIYAKKKKLFVEIKIINYV